MRDIRPIADAYRTATDEADRLRAELVAAINAAIDSGMSQAEAARQSGYTRERIRLIRKNSADL